MSATLLDPESTERFWSFVHPEPNTGCWLWAGTVAHRGGKPVEAHFALHSNPVQAGHVAWLLERGALAPGHTLRRCRLFGPACVNPAHMQPKGFRLGSLRLVRPADAARAELCTAACEGIPTIVLQELAKAGVPLAELLPFSTRAPQVRQLHAVRALLEARRARGSE